MNAELDGTVGPLLKQRATASGVIYTNVDGDQPGVTLNLYRFVRGIGVRPVLCGNIKGLHDPYRNPDHAGGLRPQVGPEATTWSPRSLTAPRSRSNRRSSPTPTGMRVGKRGMFGPTAAAGTPIEEAAKALAGAGLRRRTGHRRLRRRRFAGARRVRYRHHRPSCPASLSRSLQAGSTGPFYCFHTPYHLCHFEVPNTIARAVPVRRCRHRSRRTAMRRGRRNREDALQAGARDWMVSAIT